MQHSPSVFWFVGGTHRDTYAKAKAANQLNEVPVNHTPKFATRFILIGAVPPGAIKDWHYLGVSLAAGITTFYFPSAGMARWNPVLLFDAAGLALFAVSGAHKALVYGLNPVMATLLGALTGIGGGMARDILLLKSRSSCAPICQPDAQY